MDIRSQTYRRKFGVRRPRRRFGCFRTRSGTDGLCLESAYWPVATAPGSVTASLHVIVAALISSLMFSRSFVGAHLAWRFPPAVGRFAAAVLRREFVAVESALAVL